MKLSGKVAVVTGGSQGIGQAIATRFAAEGAEVAIIYRRNQASAAAAVADIEAAGGKARAYRGDCSNVEDIYRIVEEIARHHGGIDILVNNAGSFKTVSVIDTTEEIWDEQVDLNLKGAFFCTQALLPEFEKRGGGKIINITSIAGVGAFPNCAAYCASKGGLVNLTRALAAELASKNVNVNSIAPGNVATPINAHLRGHDQQAYIQQMRDRTPTGRAFMDPQDMAGAAVFLASDDAKGVHGAILMVDDGWAA